MKLKLEPARRYRLLREFETYRHELIRIAREIGSPKMESRLFSVGEAFYARMSKDVNLNRDDRDIEAEMDDDSGEDEPEEI